MISIESVFHLKDSFAIIRKKVIELSSIQSKDAKEFGAITQTIFSTEGQIDRYICILQRSVKCLKGVLQLEEGEEILFESREEGFEPQKTTLYLWQIINFICIRSQIVQQKLLTIVSKLLKVSIEYEFIHSTPTVKNGLIAIHNIIAKMFKQNGNFFQSQYLFEWLEAILVYHFERTIKGQNSTLISEFKFFKPEQTLTQETEWIAYLLRQIFTNSYYTTLQYSFIDMFQVKSTNKKASYYLLHMIGNFFQDMIDKRVTTQLVGGFECMIKDIKQMYDSKGKCLIELKINKQDLGWVCKRFNSTIHSYIDFTKDYICFGVNQFKQFQMGNLMAQWKFTTDFLQEFSHVLNCILFIGGYNNKLQDFIIEILLQTHKQLLEYFQISYLLYRNIQSTKYQAKVSLVVQMQKQSKRKLFTFANIQNIHIEELQVKKLRLDKILADGQLVSLLRLLTNLVHINHRAQIPFQVEPKYLHMVLSLTHDNVSQITMKEWAIMFIRNVSEWSEKLRQEIKSVKVEMKVK